MLWCANAKIDVVIFYMRNRRNVAADAIDLLGDDDVPVWAAARALRSIEVPGLWGHFAQLAPRLEWGGNRNIPPDWGSLKVETSILSPLYPSGALEAILQREG